MGNHNRFGVVGSMRCINSIVVRGVVFLLFLFSYTVEAAGVIYPTYGSGNRELVVFTDYFCTPCGKIEAELNAAIKKALAQGGWKVSFVDTPGHDETALYARYFIYAVQSGTGYENAFKAHSLLFELAGKGIRTADELASAFRKAGITFAIFDPWPVYEWWNRLLEEHQISSTPTCVVLEGKGKKTVFHGADGIRKQLLPLLNGEVKHGVEKH